MYSGVHAVLPNQLQLLFLEMVYSSLKHGSHCCGTPLPPSGGTYIVTAKPQTGKETTSFFRLLQAVGTLGVCKKSHWDAGRKYHNSYFILFLLKNASKNLNFTDIYHTDSLHWVLYSESATCHLLRKQQKVHSLAELLSGPLHSEVTYCRSWVVG